MSTRHSTKPVRSVTIKRTGRYSRLALSARIWNRRLKELAEFKKKFGHCCVSILSKTHASLGGWVVMQRYVRRKGKLSAEQVQRLDELGFNWGATKQERWEATYKILMAYRQAHGHCRVSLANGDDGSLRRWVIKQCRARRQGQLSAEQVRKLDNLGFTWDRYQEHWETMLAALVEYKRTHGNCDVPAGWPPFPGLATWAAAQRKLGRRGTLPSKPEKAIEGTGFSV